PRETVPARAARSGGLGHAPPAARRRGGTARAPAGPADRPEAAAGGKAPASGPALPVLRLLSLDARPRDYPLAAGENLVGRLPDNDVVLASPFVSRRHCAIRVLPDGACFIQDLGSKDGVHVDGERIDRPLPLRNGSVIRLGDQLLVLLPSADGTAGAEPTTAAER